MYHNGINNVFFIPLTVKFQTSAGEALKIGQKVAIILLHKDWLISIIIFVKLPPYAWGQMLRTMRRTEPRAVGTIP